MKILVVNNYGQFCHLIHRAVRDLDQDSELVSNTNQVDELLAKEPDGLILSGGPDISRSGNCDLYVRELDLPILGICLGHQVIARAFGGEIRTGMQGGYASVEVEVTVEDEILAGIGPKINVWASHADEVSQIPQGFERLARSKICEAEAMRHKEKPIFGVQWHPEVSHTERGDELLENFFKICKRHSH